MMLLLYLMCISFSLLSMEEGMSKIPESKQEEMSIEEILKHLESVTKDPKQFSKTFFVEEGWQCKPYYIYECPKCSFWTVSKDVSSLAKHMMSIHKSSPSAEDTLKNKTEKPWMLPEQWDTPIRKLFCAWLNLVNDYRKERLNTDGVTQEVKDEFENIQKLLKSKYAYFDALSPFKIELKKKKRPYSTEQTED